MSQGDSGSPSASVVKSVCACSEACEAFSQAEVTTSRASEAGHGPAARLARQPGMPEVGSAGELSVGWREVSERLHCEEGQHHE